MGLFSKTKKMDWVDLSTKEQFEEFWNSDKLFFVFKHSTRCIISSMALSQFEKKFNPDLEITPLFLDLIQHREVSNFIAEITQVVHQSPQLIVIKNKEILLTKTHEQINALELENLIV